ncbi:MAG: hypothetical protein O3C43_12510 [Verrucomicrobia bacterium]|nr:hypothetical protein [Verrucomicrobiota bacterium]MDA1067315.1 hypothetical protein [Verrucomicrobiota bacterium]
MNAAFGRVEYRSTDRFEQEYINEMQEESFQLVQVHRWWNDYVNIYDKIEYPLYLTGESNLLRHHLENLETGFTRSVEFRDDLLMALVDYPKTLEVLSILSKNHEFTWNLFQTTSSGIEIPIGMIENGEVSKSAITHMTDTISYYKFPEKDLSNTELQDRIYHNYFDENDKPIFDS